MPRRRRTANGGVVETLSRRDVQNMYTQMRREGNARGADTSAISNRNLRRRGSSGANGG